MSVDAQPIDLGVLLALAYGQFVVELREYLAEEGFDDLGRSDGYVFRALASRPMTVSDLAARLQISKQGAGQIIDDMERRGYVERRPDPSDARARLLHLTVRGEAALSAARKFHQAYERKLRRRFGDEAIDTMRGVLTEMAGEAQISTPHFRALMF